MIEKINPALSLPRCMWERRRYTIKGLKVFFEQDFR